MHRKAITTTVYECRGYSAIGKYSGFIKCLLHMHIRDSLGAFIYSYRWGKVLEYIVMGWKAT